MTLGMFSNNNNFISANKARTLAYECSNRLSPNLLEVVEDRITKAAENGDTNCTLNSIDKFGNNVRGVGCYLPPEVIIMLEEFLKTKGFSTKMEDEKDSGSISIFTIYW